MIVPRLSASLESRLAVAVGMLAWLTNRSADRAVRRNLRIVLGREPRVAEVRAVFVAAAQNYFDLLYLPRFSRSELMARVHVDGWNHLEQALAAGNGAVLASLHLGNVEIVASLAVERGLEVMLPVEQVEPPELLNLMMSLRRQAGLICEPVGQDAFRSVRAALHRNAVVGIGADRITLGSGDVVKLCGRPTRMPIAAALIAHRCQAPLLPVGTMRLGGHRFEVRIGAPIPVSQTGSRRQDLQITTQRLFDSLESFLRRNPTQWVVFRPVWEDS
ncbi:MAG TPA: hypothetical protein VNG11_05380 [Chloroflexota bacterium]|nr:hypothetical protein [Chloroflexota bacterium]